MPMTHRASGGTWHDADLSPGWHRIEVALRFTGDTPRAALLFADARSSLLIHDILVRASTPQEQKR
jgi:hypothetical protein